MDFLSDHAEESKILSGGTDLLISARNGVLESKYLVDVSRLEELRQVSVDQTRLTIGSALTFSEIVRNSTIQKFAPALIRASGQVGSLQIRNAGTLGGNVANASPAADSVPALMIHDAHVILISSGFEYSEPLSSFVTGAYRTNLKPGSIIKAFSLEIFPRGFRCAYNRIARRRSLSISRAGAAAMGFLDTDGIITDLRLSLSSISPQPARMTVVEKYLIGRAPRSQLIFEAAQTVADEMVRISGERPSFVYKKPAVVGLTIKTLEEMFLD